MGILCPFAPQVRFTAVLLVRGAVVRMGSAAYSHIHIIMSIRLDTALLRRWRLLYGAGWEGPAVAGKLIFIC